MSVIGRTHGSRGNKSEADEAEGHIDQGGGSEAESTLARTAAATAAQRPGTQEGQTLPLLRSP